MAEYLQLPRIDAGTPEGELKQIKDFIYIMVETYNRNVDEIKQQEAKNGNVH